MGIEPTTVSLENWGSTAELHPQRLLCVRPCPECMDGLASEIYTFPRWDQ